jgi:hypothetical protein
MPGCSAVLFRRLGIAAEQLHAPLARQIDDEPYARNSLKLSSHWARLILDRPHESRGAFLGQVDSIVAELERILTGVAYERPPLQPPPKTSLMLPLALQP